MEKTLDKSFIGIGSIIFLIVSMISYSGRKRINCLCHRDLEVRD